MSKNTFLANNIFKYIYNTTNIPVGWLQCIRVVLVVIGELLSSIPHVEVVIVVVILERLELSIVRSRFWRQKRFQEGLELLNTLDAYHRLSRSHRPRD